MATKKKPAAKPAPKKAAKPAAKPAPKKAAKPAAKPVAKKIAPAPKKAAKPAIAQKPVAKKEQHVKPVEKPVVVAKKPEIIQAEKPVVAVKKGERDPKSLVSIKPPIKSVMKKEPPKPTKVVIPKTTTSKSVKYEPEFMKSVLDNPINENNGPTMRYSDADLAEFRELISKKLDAAKKELAYLQGLITRKDEGGDMDEGRYMTMEDGSVSMEREQLSQMASRQITFIDHLEKAMMRIENKTYGICRVTGKLIDKARLRAVPHATLSIEAKQMMNK
ncbi:MAG: TraR/DksA C4-type zinc finger protein [Chitinophagaceae bacterium]